MPLPLPGDDSNERTVLVRNRSIGCSRLEGTLSSFLQGFLKLTRKSLVEMSRVWEAQRRRSRHGGINNAAFRSGPTVIRRYALPTQVESLTIDRFWDARISAARISTNRQKFAIFMLLWIDVNDGGRYFVWENSSFGSLRKA